MQQKRIYYDYSYIKGFDTFVVDKYVEKDNICLILEKTAFYPSSGGQPADAGTMDGLAVIDVFEREDGEIIHVISQNSVLIPGSSVHCEIDWDRRFTHMQQHTGQHILSQAFLKECSLQTVGFHLGKESSAIDLEELNLSPEKIRQAESLANRIVFENRPIDIRYLSEEEVKGKLRKDVERAGMCRIVEIKDFDLSACGGTHCRNTGEVGLILIKGWEKIKSKLRIEFFCGFRALSLFREYDFVFKEISSRFSVGIKGLVSRMDKLINDHKDDSKNLKRLKEKYFQQEIEIIYNSFVSIKDKIKYVKAMVEGKSIEDLKALARGLITKFNPVVVFLASASEPSSLVVARSKEPELNLKEIMNTCSRDFLGKGGGSPDFYQGGGYRFQDIEKILFEFEKVLNTLL